MAHSTTRRFFTAGLSAIGVTALGGGLPRPALAAGAKFKLRYGTAFPADHPGVTRIADAAKAISADTSSQIELEVFPNSQLGSEPDMFNQTRSGALVAVFAMGFGLFTPPFGVGFYLACAIGRVSPDVAIRSVWPHLGALFVALLLITLIPWISIGFL